MYHATDTVFEPLNKVQTVFVTRLELSEVAALVEFRLAPLSCRRDMAMLRMLYRTALKKGPEHFNRFLYRKEATRRPWTRLAYNRHLWQLAEHRRGRFLEILRRSARKNLLNVLFGLRESTTTDVQS